MIAFADEEGHFSGTFLGSESFVGQITEADMDAAEDRSGRGSLRDMLAAAGFAGRPRLALERDRYRGFLEAHIEQGDWLEANNLSIGVVTSIVAIWNYRITFSGVQNHAGTTRMAIRKDAGKAMMRLWARIEETFPDVAAERSVWTVGRVTLDPGAPSIIPGGAELILQFRDADPEVLDRMDAQIRALVAEAAEAGPCGVSIEPMGQSTPAVMAPEIQGAFRAGAETFAPDKWAMMPSGAGHDAQLIAQYMPTGMLFVPSDWRGQPPLV